ncbi:hypothetical protein CHH28_17095 [Bacterioplanes sanyensis]|uniref:Uncharacterized protein n=1 Tax=Bacterioplanes sanyensis TaxID=1249553 RepID=A0A222FMN2_9GAMM|nr:hypothetical protein [Bacterioplanes sanyensis]ASP40287.1 hypothetical protein CHH28_17095 [Bacterioplanes sanyensis]
MKHALSSQASLDAMHYLMLAQQISAERSQELRLRQQDRQAQSPPDPNTMWLKAFFHGWR